MHRSFLIGMLLLAPALLAQEKTYDVVVAGAGTGGVAAAIAASRLGARVALVEETDWIGGQMTAAAVGTMDEGGKITQHSGFYGEFLQAMEAEYGKLGKSTGTCYYLANSHCFEPAVSQRVLYSMIEQTRKQGHVLDVYLRQRVLKALSEGNTVRGVVTAQGLTLHSTVLIDATEYGDILPLTPAAYRLSHFTNEDLDPKACVQSMTYVAVTKRYDSVPPELVMHHAPPGDTESLSKRLQRVMSTDGNATTGVTPVNLAMHNVYRGLPDSSNPGNYDATTPSKITRSELNWFNDYPMHVKDFSGPDRVAEICAAKLKTLQVLYYIQHDMGEKNWSVANDQGYDTDYNRQNACANIPEEFRAIENNLPPMPYVRESRRLIGVYTLTAGDIRREGTPQRAVKNFPDSIAVGDYADDLHGCNGEADLEHSLEHESDRPPGFRIGPFQVPMGALVPLKVDGLLAAEKNISQSRTANGATRLQPITMLTGEAAGTLAALAVREHVPPRDVDVITVQHELLRAGSVLALEDDTDLVRDSELWQAVQFVEMKGWMSSTDGKFLPKEAMTRGQAAELLSAAYSIAQPFNEFRPAVVSKPTFSDVPLWDRYSAPVERLTALKVTEACPGKPGMFCPSRPASSSSFLRSASLLNRRHSSSPIASQSVSESNDTLTRGEAALVIYRLKTAVEEGAASNANFAQKKEVRP